jgi:hypothetical protein
MAIKGRKKSLKFNGEVVGAPIMSMPVVISLKCRHNSPRVKFKCTVAPSIFMPLEVSTEFSPLMYPP